VADEFSIRSFQTDLARALTCEDAKRWKLEVVADLTVLVSLNPVAAGQEVFQSHLAWQKYPDGLASLKFRDPATGRLDMPTAWPIVRGFRPQSLDACVNWCAEGFALHPEWRNDSRYKWVTRGNVLLKTIRILQDEMDTAYQGRFKQ
jgi:hypothetical protein